MVSFGLREKRDRKRNTAVHEKNMRGLSVSIQVHVCWSFLGFLLLFYESRVSSESESSPASRIPLACWLSLAFPSNEIQSLLEPRGANKWKMLPFVSCCVQSRRVRAHAALDELDCDANAVLHPKSKALPQLVSL